MNENEERLQLEVLICTHGSEGIKQIATLDHPRVKGVKYLICWQTDEPQPCIPEQIKARTDMMVSVWDDRGISRNRNHCLDLAMAPLVVISDDDMAYTAAELQGLIKSFEQHPDADMLIFRHTETIVERKYPDEEFNLKRLPKNLNICSVDMAFRLDSLRRAGLRFNEHFGSPNYLSSGEDVLLFYDALRNGLQGYYVPIIVGTHHGISTGVRCRREAEFIATKGAVISHLHPLTWPLRLMAHVMRETAEDDSCKPDAYIKAWLSGVIHARKHHVFSRNFTRSRAGKP